MISISETEVNKFSEKYGSPLFIVSADKIKINLKTFESSFRTKYPKVIVAYSYKVNRLPEILKVIHSQDAWAEVASGFEFEIAKKLGVSGKSIVFNGPFKTKHELLKAIQEQTLINVDHLDEITQLEEIAKESGKTIDIGIRLNMEVGIDQLPDRFGFNIESGEALQIVRECSERGFINISGLHVHLTSYILEKESKDSIPAKGINLIWPKDHKAYRKAAEKVVQFANEIKDKFRINVKYLDMGGGFPTVDEISPYVDAIVGPILEGFNDNELPALILEPGRAIVSDAADLITTVVAKKELSANQSAIVVDAGINILPTSFWKFQEIQYFSKSNSTLEETIVYGPLCLQTDILAKTDLPELNTGDRILVKNVGAYNIPQSSTFIYPQPAVLLLEGQDVVLIKKREEIQDFV